METFSNAALKSKTRRNNSQNIQFIIYTVCLFVFLPLQPTVVVFSQPGSGL
jgi:hypothetical protein